MAIVILSLILSTVLVVVNRAIAATIDNQTKMQAFELARENMEKLLGAESASEMSEFGYHETNPDIRWETTVEYFYEPITDRMWLQAVCSALYTDSTGEEQTVELTHWLTNISKADMLKILEQEKKASRQLTEEQMIEMAEVLADNADISFELAFELLQMDPELAAQNLAEETDISLENAKMLLGLGFNDAIGRLALAAGISPNEAAEVLKAPEEERTKKLEDMGVSKEIIKGGDIGGIINQPNPIEPDKPEVEQGVCGDGNCGPGENSTTCPADCGKTGSDDGSGFICCVPHSELKNMPLTEVFALWNKEQQGLCDCE